MSDDPAYVLFPNDAPAQSAPPAWRQAGQASSLNEQQQVGPLDRAASLVFASEAPTDTPAEQQKSGEERDVASQLFPTDAADGDSKDAARFTNMMGDYRLSAFKDGDEARADELQQASTTLLDDVKQSGGLAADLAEALGFVHAGMDRFGPATEDEISAGHQKAMDVLGVEYAGDTAKLNADLDAARRLIDHLEAKAPGTKASLEYSGAGNDPRMIKLAIKEARRRAEDSRHATIPSQSQGA